jgi:hypothetical protein
VGNLPNPRQGDQGNERGAARRRGSESISLDGEFALDVGNNLYPFANRLQAKTFDEFLQKSFEGLPKLAPN